MKKLLLPLLAAVAIATFSTSCKKDVSEEELLKNQLAQADSLLKRGGIIKYTVKVVSTANSSILKAKMSIENAEVTVYQNDSVYTGYTDALGFVTFANMRIGTVAVNVKLKDHAEVDYVADITPQEQLTNLSQSQIVNTIRYASTMVPMFPIADPGCATITGKVTAELDLTNTTPEPAPGVKVTAMVDVDDPDFVSRYIAPTLSSGTPSAGRMLKYAFSDATITTTTAADGTYTLKVPASLNGLPIKLSVADYQTTQKLYLENDPADGSFKPGEYTVPVIFSSNVEPSPIPEVKPVYVKVDEPTALIGYVLSEASFSFETDTEGGVTAVNVIKRGKYTHKPFVNIRNTGDGAILDAIWNATTGEVEGVTIINKGKGYNTSTSFIKATLVSSKKTAQITPVLDKNQLTQLIISDKGYGYMVKPSIKIYTPNSLTTQPEFYSTIDLWTYDLRSVLIVNAGSGYKTTLNYPLTAIRIPSTANDYKISASTSQSTIKNLDLGTGRRF